MSIPSERSAISGTFGSQPSNPLRNSLRTMVGIIQVGAGGVFQPAYTAAIIEKKTQQSVTQGNKEEHTFCQNPGSAGSFYKTFFCGGREHLLSFCLPTLPFILVFAGCCTMMIYPPSRYYLQDSLHQCISFHSCQILPPSQTSFIVFADRLTNLTLLTVIATP